MPIINQANKAPNWNLADLYGGIKDPKIVKDLNRTQRSARNFKIKYMNNLANLDDEEFGKSILEYEKLSEALGKVISFAQLLFAADAENEEIAVFYQDMNERVTTISSETLFYELEINELDDQELAGKLKNPTTMRFKPWLENIRVFSSYQLSNELEQILHEKKLTGRTAWSRLFDETMAGMRFNLDGHEISNSEIMNRMSDKDPLIRKKAAKSFAAGLSENIKLFSLITNTLAKDKGIEDKWRKFPRPVSKRNLSNQLKKCREGIVQNLLIVNNY